jgi:putative aldouronate transport system permease protein
MTAKSTGDKLFDTVNTSFFVILLLIVLYPLYFIIISSFSDPVAVNSGDVWLFPKDVTLKGYFAIFEHEKIWLGYRNSILYTSLGTLINVCLTITGGYALSRKDLAGRNMIVMWIAFTMFFNGGLIPTYLVVKSLGMLDTVWALIIPNAITVYNLIIVRTFFQQTIPDELLEAAGIDGCGNTKFFLQIVIPLSKPIIAVIVLFSAVMHWNAYFPALIYLRDEGLYPLQLVLREILIMNEAQDMAMDPTELMESQDLAELIKYGVIIVASLPVLVLYPFLQKYFVKGIMIGSIKG